MIALTADSFRNCGQRGVGIAPLEQGLRSAADFDALAATGATHARLWVTPGVIGGRYVVPPAQLSTLTKTLAALKARGMYAVLTVALDDEHRNRALWASEALQDSLVALWAALAKRVKGQTVVGAVDLLNEPVPRTELSYEGMQAAWLALAERLIGAIRAIDAKRVVIVESSPNAVPSSFDTLRGLPFSEVVYSPHSYMPYEFTHQGVDPAVPGTRDYGPAEAAALRESLRPVAAWAWRTGLPVYVGEFSAIRSAPGDSATRYVADSIALFEQHGFSYSYHEFRGWLGWDAEVAGVEYVRTADAPTMGALRRGLRRSA